MAKNRFKLRTVVQVVFFVIIATFAINHTLEEAGIDVPFLPSASLHAICPFGGVVTLYDFITNGTFVQKIHESALVLMALAFILAILVGPLFCGWICPMGSFQEWIGKIGKKIFKKKFNRFIPYKFDKYLRFLRYAVLIWVVFITAYSGKLVFSEYDPYYALFNFWSGEVAISAILILLLVSLLSLFVERPFCKYACPYGALLGLSNFIRIFKIKRNESTCISCNKCTKDCPMNIPVATSKTVRNHQCISCLECTSDNSCPVPETVEFKL